MKKIVPDTGVLIDGRITELVAVEESGVKVSIPQSVVAELEYQANTGKETGFSGLEELRRLSEMGREGKLSIEFVGERPNSEEIERARYGEIDAGIRALAKKLGAVLLTTDKIQHRVAEAEGIPVEYLHPIVKEAKLSLEKYFTGDTLSVHLKEGCVPKAKKGLPGEFVLEELGSKTLSRKDLGALIKEAVEFAKRSEDSFIEMDTGGATVLQIKNYRITVTRPPLSEAFELTAVRPITKLSLDDYALNDALRKRIEGGAEGIVIAGPPGSGKSTLATALAEHYANKGKIVKTLEQPRDLQVNREITQYAPLDGSFTNTADILLLVRPDYTVYDELRKPSDFLVFSDLRMAGIGMVGVVHASKPIDAIQRFIGKIELGVIPQVIDTILFVEKGRIAKVFVLSFAVRVPSGMRDQDLARPVIEVRDFSSKELEYEIYKFGDETVVFPVKSGRQDRSEGGFGGGSGSVREQREYRAGKSFLPRQKPWKGKRGRR